MSPRAKPETIVVSLRMPVKLHRWLKVRAVTVGESMESYILGILSQLMSIKEKSK